MSVRLTLNHALDFTLLAVIGLASFFDIKERRVPNWVILFGLSTGIVLAAFQGNTQLILSIIGFAIAIVALLIPFALGWMGAGDVKLFAAVGSLIGYTPLPRVFFYSCITAGVTALLAVVIGKVKQVSFKILWSDCKFTFLTMRIGLSKSMRLESGAYSVPWGVAIGAGTIMAYYLDPSGTWAGF